MTQTQTHSTGIVASSIDRIQNAVESAQTEFEKFQKDLEKRRKRFEKRATKEFKRIQTDIRANPAVQRAEQLQKDVSTQIETGLDNLLGGLQIASRRDLVRLDKKLNKINKKLTALDKALSSNPNGAAVAAE